ncbi:MAG: hypothetical protein WA197_20075 [Candidatus Acidiferrales bacterium]
MAVRLSFFFVSAVHVNPELLPVLKHAVRNTTKRLRDAARPKLPFVGGRARVEIENQNRKTAKLRAMSGMREIKICP